MAYPQEDIDNTKAIFDFCFADEIKEHEHQIQVNCLKTQQYESPLVNYVEEYFKSILILLFLDQYRTTHGTKLTWYAKYLEHQFEKARNKRALLKAVGRSINPTQVSTPGVHEITSRTTARHKFHDEIEYWLLSKNRLLKS